MICQTQAATRTLGLFWGPLQVRDQRLASVCRRFERDLGRLGPVLRDAKFHMCRRQGSMTRRRRIDLQRTSLLGSLEFGLGGQGPQL